MYKNALAIMRLVKLFEIGIMVVGAAGFLTQNLMLRMTALFLTLFIIGSNAGNDNRGELPCGSSG